MIAQQQDLDDLSGDIKRVYEAIYVKVLVTGKEFLPPTAEGMTPSTTTLFELLYPGQLQQAAEA